MKKRFYLFFLIFSFFGFCLQIYAKENLFSGSFGFSTGIPFENEKQNYNDLNRIIIGSLGTFNINPIDEVSFFIGGEILCDFLWSNDFHKNTLHYSFPFGIKFYPKLEGFCFGLGYVLGSRTDFLKNSNFQSTKNFAWGNGLKLLVEYNFAKKGNSQFLPTIGINYQNIPRGDFQYENLLTFYLLANF